MVKRTKEKVEQTKKALVDAAIKVFHKKGYSNTTLEEIALEAGLTRGALYWHFKGKAEILISIYGDFMEKLDALIAETVDREDATLASVAEYMKRAINLLITDYSFMVTLEMLFFKAEFTGDLESVKSMENKWTTRRINKISFLVEEHLKQSKLKVSMDPGETALAIESLFRGLSLMYTTNSQVIPGKDSHVRIIDTFFQSILNPVQ